MFTNITFNNQPLTHEMAIRLMMAEVKAEYGEEYDRPKNGHTEAESFAACFEVCLQALLWREEDEKAASDTVR